MDANRSVGSRRLYTGRYAAPDVDGHEAQRFHAHTSGETLLYNASGKLLFQGGITGRRGHEGDNAGRAACLSLLTSERAPLSHAPVFGCAL